MPVRVLAVGRLFGELKAEQRHNGARRVGEVIERVRGDRDAFAERSHQKLSRKQQNITKNADPPGQLSILRPDGRILRVGVVFHKQPQQ